MTANGGAMHEERRDELAAYALGSLGEKDSAGVAEHLAGCEPCRDYVRWLQPAVDLLPASVARLEPPERLRESLMATIHAEAREADPLHAPDSAAGAGSPSRRRSWRGLMLRPATGLAAVVVLGGGAVAGYELASPGDEDGRSTIAVQAQGSVADAELVASVEHGAGGSAILHVERAPALERGHFYQAWVSRDGVMEPSASFRPHRDGSYEAVLDDTLQGADAVLVTEEPERHSQRPSKALVMRAPLR